jgi:hypothetical protein
MSAFFLQKAHITGYLVEDQVPKAESYLCIKFPEYTQNHMTFDFSSIFM